MFEEFYYLHSYSAVSDQKCTIAAETNYGGHPITGNPTGKFIWHAISPGESGSAGLNLLKNFAMVREGITLPYLHGEEIAVPLNVALIGFGSIASRHLRVIKICALTPNSCFKHQRSV